MDLKAVFFKRLVCFKVIQNRLNNTFKDDKKAVGISE